MPHGLSEGEERVLELLRQTWNAYHDLPQEHQMEPEEFCHGIHHLQAIVGSRPTWRALRVERPGG